MTKLSPLEEVLFQTWSRAHGVDNQDDPNNQFDHRGLYKQTNGLIMPGHVVRQMADTHNKAMEPQEGGDMTFPDPYMAQAEMHKANLDSQSKSQSDQLKMQMEDKKLQHKLMIEQLKIQHQAGEKEKERQFKVQEGERARQQQAVEAQQAREHAMQDAQMNRQNQLEDQQRTHQHEMQGQVMQEQFARTRPQPEPTPMQGQPQTTDSVPQGSSGLQEQLMQRAQGQGI